LGPFDLTVGWASVSVESVAADFISGDSSQMNSREVQELVEVVEDEVNNGGFHQFFYNNAGDNTEETIQALEAIGATQMADIVRRAAAMFPGGMPPKNRFSRQGVLLENFPRAEAFKSLDDEFFAYPENLTSLLDRYKSLAR
jgi:hypothetical protein